MPHVVVKMNPGRTEAQKEKLAEAITQAVMTIAVCPEAAVSVAIEEVASADWVEQVYKPEIKGNWDKIYKKPGYDPK